MHEMIKMIREIREHLRLNRTGEQSDRLTLDYIELAINYKRKKLPEPKNYSLIGTYYGGVNPND